ncbi:MAG: ADP-ribosylglycohydrolase family protein, partial [Oscillospiraceae bacterium]|nr:ADP-ribosylglycohydrolase family protein [Oscillospiraceae bacterium]
METKYMLEIKAGERYAIQKFTFGEPISFPQFRLTVAEPGESGCMKVSMELLALMTVANCGVRGGHYSAGAVLELVFDPSGNAFAYAYDTRGEEFRFRIMSTDALLDRFSGCILGGAVGDALGYAVEFERYDDIIELYGEDGIRNFSLENGKALISDDTQMTLFTMEGLSSGIFRADSKGVGAAAETYVNLAYCDWYVTQAGREDYSPFTPIFADRRLHEWRAPGNTCLQALSAQFENSAFVPYSTRYGTLGKPVNDSKGCGAVMRAAPAGLMLSSNNYKGESAALVAAKTGA